ncbi:hypothetical protein [Acidovorax sp. Root217]|uniref:hypothetical protein n=1 Tax=Acidovorax sp. Root217 TaxID=1736492 RepID=UPI00070D2823|nr:hypothetical protein [Acidovorax sp. Root217]KRC24377.1 hypothetical protein ASE31_21425 [Acidovorax sp. Root217]
MFESIATAPAPTVRVHPPLPSRAFGVASKELEARTALRPTRMDALNRLATKEERLPFWVRLVRNEADLRKAVHIRHAAYARHVPDLAHQLQEPEATDYEDGVVVLLAESKLDGSPLGTARIQSNRFRALSVEQSVELPAWMDGMHLAEVTRLGIVGGTMGRLVKTVLIKAAFQYCERQGIEQAIAAGRAPIDRHYEQLLFEDLFPATGFIPLAHAGNLLHRVMAFDIDSGPARWQQAQHPALNFFCHTRHPDIDMGPVPVHGLPAGKKPAVVAPTPRRASASGRGRELPPRISNRAFA